MVGMAFIFEVTLKSGRVILLPQERWEHIMYEHPAIGSPEMIKDALLFPTKIKKSLYDPETVEWYFRYLKDKRRYLLVAVKYLNGEGFVITAYYVNTIK